jgi:hypothetical protein
MHHLSGAASTIQVTAVCLVAAKDPVAQHSELCLHQGSVRSEARCVYFLASLISQKHSTSGAGQVLRAPSSSAGCCRCCLIAPYAPESVQECCCDGHSWTRAVAVSSHIAGTVISKGCCVVDDRGTNNGGGASSMLAALLTRPAVLSSSSWKYYSSSQCPGRWSICTCDNWWVCGSLLCVHSANGSRWCIKACCL